MYHCVSFVVLVAFPLCVKLNLHLCSYAIYMFSSPFMRIV